MKATSVFGGLQVFNIIIAVIRSKFVAVLLGPAGMGVFGLLTATLGVIGGLTNFGLGTSAVKNIAAAHASGNQLELNSTVAVFRRLVWATGLLGLLVTLLLSPWLSEITFGNKAYTLSFVLVSVTLLVGNLSSGHSVILRGTRKIQYLAKAGIIGSGLSLAATVPLYYFLGEEGIVPGMILTAIINLLLSWYFANKIYIEPIKTSISDVIREGKGMLKMGFMISLSGLITILASYLVRIYVSSKGGVSEVGLYNAGFTIINTYVGMIFTSMSTDFYPRLSAVAQDNSKCKQEINQQAEIAILLLAPILIVFLAFIEWVIILLYSTKFTPVTGMVHWAALGIFFKASSWAMAFILLAKSKSKLFFWNELITNVYMIILNIIGYKYFGLTGLGISFLIAYIIYCFQVYFLTKYLYNFSFENSFIKIFIIQVLLALVNFVIISFLEDAVKYVLCMIVIIISVVFSVKELDKRIGLLKIIKDKF